MPMVGGWVASPDTYRFDSCRALFGEARSEKREASSEKKKDEEADKASTSSAREMSAPPERLTERQTRMSAPPRKVLEALTLLARGLVPKTRGPFTGPGRFDSCS